MEKGVINLCICVQCCSEGGAEQAVLCRSSNGKLLLMQEGSVITRKVCNLVKINCNRYIHRSQHFLQHQLLKFTSPNFILNFKFESIQNCKAQLF